MHVSLKPYTHHKRNQPVGKTFKDKRKFDRKHDRNDGLKEPKRVPKKRRPIEDDDEFSEYEEE
jgi:hypothetical protein